MGTLNPIPRLLSNSVDFELWVVARSHQPSGRTSSSTRKAVQPLPDLNGMAALEASWACLWRPTQGPMGFGVSILCRFRRVSWLCRVSTVEIRGFRAEGF